MPSDIKECSLYSFTVHGVKTKTTPMDITARALAQEAKELAQNNQGALDATQMAAVNSGITAQKVAAYDAISVPTKTSDLTNDSGFLTGYTETDPTVPSWAKAPTKPTYTATEVGALPDTTAIPAASFANPQMDGTAVAGSSADYARADHVHPSDSSKQDALTVAQLEAVNSGVTATKVAAWDSIVVPSITKITHNVQTKSNTLVTPFGAYAEVNIESEIATNGTVLSVMAHHGSTNPGYGMVHGDRVLRVYSAQAATFSVDIFYLK